jgi:hypothetical protein
MRKAIFMLMLVGMSNNALAKWVKLGEIEDTGFYYNPSKIHKEGNEVKMWALMDYKTAKQTIEGRSYLSDMSQEEYDCKKVLRRTLKLSMHSKNMGTGKIVYSSTLAGKWVHIAPNSTVEDLWKIACGKK